MILVAGEALIDLVPDADGRLAPHPGGGPYNAARTLARLGAPVALLARVSGDGYGDWLRRELVDDGVRLDAVVDAGEDPTSLALVDIDEQHRAHYRYYHEGTSAAGLTAGDALAVLPAGVEAMHVGTLGLVWEPMATAVEAAVTALSGTGLIFVDPNCRPWAIRDEATYRARMARVLARAHVVKVSDDDLAWLTPQHDSLAGARALLEPGPRVVLLTRGPEGATVVTRDGEYDVPAPPIELVDTIGAGDAFGGGFLAWLARHGHGREALADPELVRAATDYGVRVAARTCERPGASPPTRDELPD